MQTIYKSFSLSLEQFFITVGHNNFQNKIPHIIVLSLSGSYIPIHSIRCLPCESGPVKHFQINWGQVYLVGIKTVPSD